MSCTVAGLGGARDVSPLSVQFFFQFHAVFGENGQNNRFASPPLGSATTVPTQSALNTDRFIPVI